MFFLLFILCHGYFVKHTATYDIIIMNAIIIPHKNAFVNKQEDIFNVKATINKKEMRNRKQSALCLLTLLLQYRQSKPKCNHVKKGFKI